jgi:hypothetical protein
MADLSSLVAMDVAGRIRDPSEPFWWVTLSADPSSTATATATATVRVTAVGDGPLSTLVETFADDKITFSVIRVIGVDAAGSRRTKTVFLTFSTSAVPRAQKAQAMRVRQSLKVYFVGHTFEMEVFDDKGEIDKAAIEKRLTDASGAFHVDGYEWGTGSRVVLVRPGETVPGWGAGKAAAATAAAAAVGGGDVPAEAVVAAPAAPAAPAPVVDPAPAAVVDPAPAAVVDPAPAPAPAEPEGPVPPSPLPPIHRPLTATSPALVDVVADVAADDAGAAASAAAAAAAAPAPVPHTRVSTPAPWIDEVGQKPAVEGLAPVAVAAEPVKEIRFETSPTEVPAMAVPAAAGVVGKAFPAPSSSPPSSPPSSAVEEEDVAVATPPPHPKARSSAGNTPGWRLRSTV